MNALIVVDMQMGFINQYTDHLPKKIDSHIANTKYDKIIFTQFINSKNSMFSQFLKWNKLQTIKEQQIVLKSKADLIVKKETYSAMTIEVENFLNQNNIKTIFICGVDTDSCVLKTSFDAFDKGFYTKIIENLSFSTGGQYFHNSAINILKRSIGLQNVIQLN